MKWIKRFKILRNGFKNVMSLHNIWNGRQIAADIKQKLELNKRCFMEKSVVFILSYQTNGNHATELSTVGHAISERHWKSNFNFNEIINNYRLKRRNVFQIVIFISHFSLELFIQFWKYFQRMVLGSSGWDYCCKIWLLEFLAIVFFLGCLSVFKYYMKHELTIPCLLRLALLTWLSY